MPEKFDKAVYPIVSQAGIKRDGTTLDGNFYTDGVWCRFRNGRPKKIGGYREIANGLDGPIRGMFIQSQGASNIVFNLSGSGIECVPVNDEGVGGSSYDRTPATFTAGTNYTWTADVLFDSSGGGTAKIIAHASDSLSNIKSTTNTAVYYGDTLVTTALVPLTTPQSVSGGVVVLQPSLFIYGNDGLIKNSEANNPGAFAAGISNEVNVSGTKIVKGLPLRGGSNAPAGMFWALDSLIRVSFVGGTDLWRYDTLTTKSTVLSSSSIVDYDGVFYWPGVDRFLMYNGVVKEVTNQMNQDFFFDNMNWAMRQKVWASANPRWGEIWWFFPYGDSVECNHAIIYNVRENSWYDTPISRSAGYSPRVLYFPVWADSATNDFVSTDTYRIYRHETGVDHVYDEQQVAIPSSFETSDMGFASGGPGGQGIENPNVQTKSIRIEPDFIQTGVMEVSVTGSSFAQIDATDTDSVEFNPDDADYQGYVDIATQRRLLRLKFSSNVQGGDYFMGKTLCHLEPGDPRQ